MTDINEAALRVAVEVAVREAVEKHGGTPGLLVSEFLVVAAANGWDADGDEVSQVLIIPVDGSTSRMLGLIENARIRMHADVLSSYED